MLLQRIVLAFSLFIAGSAFAAAGKTDPTLVSAFLKGQTVQWNMNVLILDPEFQASDLGERAPWSGSYLPGNAGYAANPYTKKGRRYSNENFDANYADWRSNRRPYYRGMLTSLSPKEIRLLAPAEKYDLLIGTFGAANSFTDAMWMKADELQSESLQGNRLREIKPLPTWTGLCHGYAPASTMFARPRGTLMLESVAYTLNGRQKRFMIPFFPDDLKALATVAYAHSYQTYTSSNPNDWLTKRSIVPMNFGRCDSKIPLRNSTGRAKKPECLDAEPGFWHLAATHLIAKRKHSFVIDWDFHSPVNNHSIRGYKVEYFHPITGRIGSYNESTAGRMDISREDLFAKHRLPETMSIVGVKMTVTRVEYRQLTAKETDSPAADKNRTMDLLYDLELDAAGNIIGGEWRNTIRMSQNPFVSVKSSKPHPDFIWWAPEDVVPYAWTETGTDGLYNPLPLTWDLSGPIPDDLAEKARWSAANHIVWAVDGREKGKDDIYPQVPYQIISTLINAAAVL